MNIRRDAKEPQRSWRPRLEMLGCLVGLMCATAAPPLAWAAPLERRADLQAEPASPDVRRLADWVVVSADNQGLPFVIIDKVEARVFVFYPDGRLQGAAPALLGMARGDTSSPGIGERPLSAIRPEERTTPAGRFVASIGRDLAAEDVLWVDYDAAVSLHRVVPGKPKERRAQRLASPSPEDNRISYGCINVPVAFFDTVILPAFQSTSGIVYTLPEVRSLHDVFASYDVPPLPAAQGLAADLR